MSRHKLPCEKKRVQRENNRRLVHYQIGSEKKTLYTSCRIQDDNKKNPNILFILSIEMHIQSSLWRWGGEKKICRPCTDGATQLSSSESHVSLILSFVCFFYIYLLLLLLLLCLPFTAKRWDCNVRNSFTQVINYLDKLVSTVVKLSRRRIPPCCAAIPRISSSFPPIMSWVYDSLCDAFRRWTGPIL